MNPYDICVENWLVNGLQQSIIFHVAYFKLRHKDTKVDESFIGFLREEYQRIFENGSGTVQVNRGKVHKYLGMTLDYYKVGQVKITMLDYIDEIIDSIDK